MLVFPPGWTPQTPYTLVPISSPVGYLLRGRRRIPVYRDATAHALSLAALPLLALSPQAVGTAPPGAALFVGERLVYAAGGNRRDPQVQAVLQEALALGRETPLVTWDATCWEEELMHFRTFGQDGPALALCRLPVFCLRSLLEECELDALTLGHACLLLDLPEPGHGVLARAFALRELRDRLLAWHLAA